MGILQIKHFQQLYTQMLWPQAAFSIPDCRSFSAHVPLVTEMQMQNIYHTPHFIFLCSSLDSLLVQIEQSNDYTAKNGDICVTVTREGRGITSQSSVISETALDLAHMPTCTHRRCYLNTASLYRAIYTVESISLEFPPNMKDSTKYNQNAVFWLRGATCQLLPPHSELVHHVGTNSSPL